MVERAEDVAAALEAFLREKALLRRQHPLRYLFWESTLRCNLECLHCGSDCYRDNATASRELSAEAICNQLQQIARSHDAAQITFAIIGGEPLVRSDIDAVGRYAADLGYAWGITTNGLLLSKARLASLKAAGLSTISVSVDGLAADHDRLRQRDGAFAMTVAALQRLVADPFYQAFDVICCVSTLNIHRLEPFVDYLAQLGVPRLRLTPVFSRGRAGTHSDLKLSGAQYRQLLAFIAAQRATRRDIEVTLSEEGYWGPNWECKVRDGMHYCGSGTVIASILYDGQITGCPSVSRKFIEGSLADAAFVDIWENRFERFRKGRRKTAPQACRACAHWDLCEGGGFHLFDPANPGTSNCGLRLIDEMWT